MDEMWYSKFNTMLHRYRQMQKGSELSTGPQRAQTIKLSMPEAYSSSNKPHWICLLGYWHTSWVFEGTQPLASYLKVQLKQTPVSPVVAHCSIATCLWFLLCKYVPMDISSLAKMTKQSPKRSDKWICILWCFLEMSSDKPELILILKSPEEIGPYMHAYAVCDSGFLFWNL